MSDKSNKYGYVGVDIPAQSFGSNKGVFNPAEINELVADNKWTQYGQLELIETQTVSSAVASVEFTNLGDYNVHFITMNNQHTSGSTDGNAVIQLSNNGGSSYITSGYQYAHQVGNTAGSFTESRSTSHNSLGYLGDFISDADALESSNAYTYLYNLLDSTKYSFSTYQQFSYLNVESSAYGRFYFGSAVKPTAETHNALRIVTYQGYNLSAGTFSLYGIRYS